jgi:hypothetical protein
MFNSKIASLEARISRLEGHLTRRASNRYSAFSLTPMGPLVQYLNIRWEEAGGKFQEVADTMVLGEVDAVDAQVTLKQRGPNIKMIVKADGQKYEDEVPFLSNEQVNKALEKLIGEVY